MKKLYTFLNWKMYLGYNKSVELAKECAKLAGSLPASNTLAIFPSSLAFKGVQEVLGDTVAVGAQNVYWVEEGGYTGEVSSEMYAELGASYVLVGHSERRHVFKETNHDVREKMTAVLADGLTPVLCVGETLHERNEGVAAEVVESQVRAAFTGIVWPKKIPLIVAYEPVWAIGTGESCDPAEADRMADLTAGYISALVPGAEPHVLYGGSVRPENVLDYVSLPSVDGVLIGGASTKLESLTSILKAMKV